MREEGKMWEKGEEKGDVFFVGGTVVYEGEEKALKKAAAYCQLMAHKTSLQQLWK